MTNILFSNRFTVFEVLIRIRLISVYKMPFKKDVKLIKLGGPPHDDGDGSSATTPFSTVTWSRRNGGMVT